LQLPQKTKHSNKTSTQIAHLAWFPFHNNIPNFMAHRTFSTNNKTRTLTNERGAHWKLSHCPNTNLHWPNITLCWQNTNSHTEALRVRMECFIFHKFLFFCTILVHTLHYYLCVLLLLLYFLLLCENLFTISLIYFWPFNLKPMPQHRRTWLLVPRLQLHKAKIWLQTHTHTYTDFWWNNKNLFSPTSEPALCKRSLFLCVAQP